MMDKGTTVSTTPLEWRSRVRAIAQAHPVVVLERDVGQRLLLMREQLKGLPRKERMTGGHSKSSLPRQIVDGRTK